MQLERQPGEEMPRVMVRAQIDDEVARMLHGPAGGVNGSLSIVDNIPGWRSNRVHENPGRRGGGLRCEQPISRSPGQLAGR